MDAITHLLVGRLLAEGLGPGSAALAWLVTLFAILPDFDTISWVFPRLRRYIRHRGLTHTLPFGLGASVAAGAVFALAGWAPFHVAALVAFAGFASHVALDVLNWGAPVLSPWRRKSVEWTIHGGFVWSAAFSAASLVALAVARIVAPASVDAFAAVIAALFGSYLALRAALKLRTARRHPGRRVIPTGNPFVWLVADAA